MTIYHKLSAVQGEIKVPKGQYNSFGKYRYRSCEDILAEVKPVVRTHNALIVLSDDIVLIGDRYYVKACASFVDLDSGEQIVVTANAREDESKKGMDGSQITGTASSYARKYALNGLLNLDDVKDADTDEQRNERDGRAAAWERPHDELKPYRTEEDSAAIADAVDKIQIEILQIAQAAGRDLAAVERFAEKLILDNFGRSVKYKDMNLGFLVTVKNALIKKIDAENAK